MSTRTARASCPSLRSASSGSMRRWISPGDRTLGPEPTDGLRREGHGHGLDLRFSPRLALHRIRPPLELRGRPAEQRAGQGAGGTPDQGEAVDLRETPIDRIEPDPGRAWARERPAGTWRWGFSRARRNRCRFWPRCWRKSGDSPNEVERPAHERAHTTAHRDSTLRFHSAESVRSLARWVRDVASSVHPRRSRWFVGPRISIGEVGSVTVRDQ
jgi:hypothetical protein